MYTTIKDVKTQIKNHRKMLKIYSNDLRFVSQVNGWLCSLGYLNKRLKDIRSKQNG